MAFIPVPGCVKVAISYTAPGSIAVILCHLARTTGSTSAWSLADLITVATAFTSEWQEEVLALQNSHCTLNSLTFTDLTTVTGFQTVQSPAANGGIVQGILPDQDAVLVKLTTAQRGRSFRGRMYLPYFSQTDQNTNGELLPATSTALNTAITAVRNDLGLASPATDFAIASRFSGTDKTIPGHRPKPIPRVGGGFFTLIQTATPQPEFAIQRRRRHL